MDVVSCGTCCIAGKTIVQLIGLEQSIVEKFCIVKFKMQRGLDVPLKRALWVFDGPGTDGIGEVVLADQGFSDNIGVSE